MARQRGERGMGIGLFFLFFLFLLLLIFCIDMGYIFYNKECQDEDFVACFQGAFTGEDEKAPEGTVAAVGTVSGEYGGEERSVTFTLNIPLEGGSVTGSFEGDCEGKITGTFAGGNGGAISGKGNGSCVWVMPASGEFSGTVNTTSKTVPISGSGRVPGFSGEGSLTLTYKTAD